MQNQKTHLRIAGLAGLALSCLASACAQPPDEPAQEDNQAVSGTIAVGTVLQATAAAKLRATPGGTILASIAIGDTVTVAAATPTSGSYQVTSHGQPGWVFGDFFAVASAPAPSHWSFANSALDGAGFQNVIAASPFTDASGKRPIIVGADIAGVHRSLDGGKSWTPANRGLGDPHIASLMFSDTVAGKVYAATDSAVFVSTDFGLNWTRRAGAVDFDANGTYLVTGSGEHPRPTGALLAQVTTGTTKYLWAATATQGIKRSTNDGTSYDVVALAGEHLRSVAVDPANPDKLYVAVAHKGLFVSSNARGAMTFTLAGGSPDIPEELAFVNGKLYVAAHAAGIFLYDGAWHPLNTGIPGGALWESITGRKDSAGNTVLYAGCAIVQGGKAVMKSVNGGASWTTISTGTGVTVSSILYGTSITWWASDSSYLRFAAPSYVSSQILIDPDDSNGLLIAGRGGVWHGEQSGTATAWAPAHHGLVVTVNMITVADPKLPGRVYVGSMDYTFLASNDRGQSIAGAAPPGAPTTGDVIALDPETAAGQPSTVFLGASQRGDNTGVGAIWSSVDPLVGDGGWQSEGLPVADDVIALGVGHVSPGGARVVLAAVSQHGLWRKLGNKWNQVTGTAPFQSVSQGYFAWRAGTATVFAIDGVGVWRSDNAGASWLKLVAAAATYDTVNAIALDPIDPQRIYVSGRSFGGIARLDHADTSSAIMVPLLALGSPGSIATTASGSLLAHDAGGSRLMLSNHPRDAAPSFSPAADAYYSDNNAGIRSLAVGPDNYVYTASNHAGFSVGAPLP